VLETACATALVAGCPFPNWCGRIEPYGLPVAR